MVAATRIVVRRADRRTEKAHSSHTAPAASGIACMARCGSAVPRAMEAPNGATSRPSSSSTFHQLAPPTAETASWTASATATSRVGMSTQPPKKPTPVA